MDDDDVPGAQRRPLNPNLLLTLALLPEGTAWVPVLYGDGFTEGKWSEADVKAFELLGVKGQREAIRRHLAGHRQQLPEPVPERRQYRPRQDRLETRRVVPGIRYVRRHSLDPILDARLSSGACRTLAYLIARCGKDLRFRTVTCWVAQALAVTTRTIQNHYKALQAAGYIFKSLPDKRGCTTVYLTAACEPAAFKKSSSATKDLLESSAKEMSHNQPIKGEEERRKEEGGSGGNPAQQVSVAGSPPVTPVAELHDRAPPPECPSGESMPPEPLREDEGQQHPGEPLQGIFGGAKAVTAFDEMMLALRRKFDDAFAERKERGT